MRYRDKGPGSVSCRPLEDLKGKTKTIQLVSLKRRTAATPCMSNVGSWEKAPSILLPAVPTFKRAHASQIKIMAAQTTCSTSSIRPSLTQILSVVALKSQMSLSITQSLTRQGRTERGATLCRKSKARPRPSTTITQPAQQSRISVSKSQMT